MSDFKDKRFGKEPRHPTASTSMRRIVAARLRKESNNRGEKDRQQIEGRAPKWRNEPGVLEGTSSTRKGQSVTFHPGSFPGGLSHNLKTGR